MQHRNPCQNQLMGIWGIVISFLFVSMISKQQIPVAGLQLTVYGLEEYKNKGGQGPVAVMFAMHGRLRKNDIHEQSI